MKVRHNTPDLLIVEQVPRGLGVMLFLLVMAFVISGVVLLFAGEWTGLILACAGGGLGFAAICAFVERLQVTLDGPARTATIRRRTVLGQGEVVLPLAGLVGAKTETTNSSGKTHQTLYRPVLVLDHGTGEGETRHPVSKAYASGCGPGRLVMAVNGWLDMRRNQAAQGAA